MKINVPVTPPVEIEVDEKVSFKALVDTLAGLPAVQKIARDEGKDSYYTRFYAERDMGESVALMLGRAYTRGGVEAFEDLVYSEEWGEEPEDYYRHNVQSDLEKALSPVAEGVIEQVEHLEGLETELAEALAEELRDICCDAIGDNDKSSPSDLIPDHADVEVAFVPDYDKVGGIDDLHTSHRDVCSEATTVYPDANFLRLLKLINMAPSEYLAAVKETYDVDLTVPEYKEGDSDFRREDKERMALRWAALLDVEKGTSENISKLPLRGKYEIAEWNSAVDIINTIKDYDRPIAVSNKTLMYIMNEASYGGVPCFVCRLPLKKLVNGAFDKPILVTGGQIGLHHFGNGSGYLDTPDAPVLIDPSKGRFYIQSDRKNAIDDVYGMVARAYRIEATPYEVPAWQRVKPNVWRRDGEDGYVTITQEKAEDFVYWVASFDKDGNHAGPRSNAEVFNSIFSAKEEGDRIVNEPMTTEGMTP